MDRPLTCTKCEYKLDVFNIRQQWLLIDSQTLCNILVCLVAIFLVSACETAPSESFVDGGNANGEGGQNYNIIFGAIVAAIPAIIGAFSEKIGRLKGGALFKERVEILEKFINLQCQIKKQHGNLIFGAQTEAEMLEISKMLASLPKSVDTLERAIAYKELPVYKKIYMLPKPTNLLIWVCYGYYYLFYVSVFIGSLAYLAYVSGLSDMPTVGLTPFNLIATATTVYLVRLFFVHRAYKPLREEKRISTNNLSSEQYLHEALRSNVVKDSNENSQ